MNIALILSLYIVSWNWHILLRLWEYIIALSYVYIKTDMWIKQSANKQVLCDSYTLSPS